MTIGIRAQATRWQRRLRTPLFTAQGTIEDRVGLHLGVRNALGQTALGAVAPLPGFSAETLDEAEAVLTRLIQHVDIVRSLPAAPADRIEWFAEHELPSSVAHGVEQAVLTLRAIPLNSSLASLLAAEQGLTPRPTVPTHRLWTGTAAAAPAPSASLRSAPPPVRGRMCSGPQHANTPPQTGGDVREAAPSASHFVLGTSPCLGEGVCGSAALQPPPQTGGDVREADRGGTLKIKVGADLDDAEARVRAAREAFGDAIELRADANGAWSPDEAPEALRRLARLGVAWIEQPIAHDAPDALAHMAELRARKLGIGIAADESVRSTEDARAVLAAGAADALVIKPMFCGGLATALEIGRQAAAAHVAVSVTGVLDSVIGEAAARAVAAAMPGRLISCGLETSNFFVDDDELQGEPT